MLPLCFWDAQRAGVNTSVENRLFFHRFSKAVFEAAQEFEWVFHGFHMPYYY